MTKVAIATIPLRDYEARVLRGLLCAEPPGGGKGVAAGSAPKRRGTLAAVGRGRIQENFKVVT